MPTPRQRAIDAQVELYRIIREPFRDREEIAEALCSVVSTGQIAERGAGGIQVSHGFKGLREADPARWTALEEAAWKVIEDDRALDVIWQEVASQVYKVGVKVENLSDIVIAHKKKHFGDAA